jgi:hypothetical protein
LPKGSSTSTSRRRGAGDILLAAADAAAIGDGDVGAGRPAHAVGDQVADRRLPVRTVVERLSSGTASLAISTRELARQFLGRFRRAPCSRSGDRGAVHDPEIRPPGHRAPAAAVLGIDGQVDGGTYRPFLGLDHGGAPVEQQRQVMVVARQISSPD